MTTEQLQRTKDQMSSVPPLILASLLGFTTFFTMSPQEMAIASRPRCEVVNPAKANTVTGQIELNPQKTLNMEKFKAQFNISDDDMVMINNINPGQLILCTIISGNNTYKFLVTYGVDAPVIYPFKSNSKK